MVIDRRVLARHVPPRGRGWGMIEAPDRIGPHAEPPCDDLKP